MISHAKYHIKLRIKPLDMLAYQSASPTSFQDLKSTYQEIISNDISRMNFWSQHFKHISSNTLFGFIWNFQSLCAIRLLLFYFSTRFASTTNHFPHFPLHLKGKFIRLSLFFFSSLLRYACLRYSLWVSSSGIRFFMTWQFFEQQPNPLFVPTYSFFASSASCLSFLQNLQII